MRAKQLLYFNNNRIRGEGLELTGYIRALSTPVVSAAVRSTAVVLLLLIR